MLDLLKNCRLCGRNCGVNRLNGELGFCNSGKTVKIARVSLHDWEEPCISGINGSGTIFFSNCNLKCVFCQNYKISSTGFGQEISIKRLSEIFLEQQQRGAHNINLVTPTHYVPQIIEALDIAKSQGLNIPILFNTNGYENPETIKILSGYIDVYLPDLKYFSNKYSIKYSNAPDYFEKASTAIKEMFLQVGESKFDENGLIQKGIIIRHLMLPGLLFDSKKIIDYIYKTYRDSIYISIMNQYTPMYNAKKFPEINKSLNPKHYDSLVDYCLSLEIKNAFIQEVGTSSENFVPDFDLRGI
ncbi:radical SAM protein [Clostridium thailandense]|uniref:Radical SAM protein n=1 Tax=Clostridium thailandense TaxID=2794346 RepID=A0A949TWS0_9CLOT|nr:radical SAM protein [Clostridium thailandense]MBV7273301.1 radical SAM protein [Clostridium thailandense]MCH5137326.1 radical SAM protein [Clostridiaceae bacterium UIB06]